MGSAGVGGTVSAASDVSLNSPANNDLFTRMNGYWQNVPGSDRYALTTNGGSENVHTQNASGATSIDLNNGNVFNVTLTGSATLSFANAISGKATSFTLYLKQDGTGSRTVTWPSGTKWSGGAPTLSTGANAVDILVLESLDGGTNWYASVVGTNFS